jgi:hypothetical protein
MVIRSVSWAILSVWKPGGRRPMAKKKAGAKPVPATAEEPAIRHARIELPDEDYQRLTAAAKRYRISIAAYIRMAVIERIERDEGRGR